MTRVEHGGATPFFAIGALAVSFFLYAWSAIVVPGVPTRALLPLLWVVLCVLAVRWFVARPRWSLTAGLLTIVVWFAVLYGGLVGSG